MQKEGRGPGRRVGEPRRPLTAELSRGTMEVNGTIFHSKEAGERRERERSMHGERSCGFGAWSGSIVASAFFMKRCPDQQRLRVSPWRMPSTLSSVRPKLRVCTATSIVRDCDGVAES